MDIGYPEPVIKTGEETCHGQILQKFQVVRNRFSLGSGRAETVLTLDLVSAIET